MGGAAVLITGLILAFVVSVFSGAVLIYYTKKSGHSDEKSISLCKSMYIYSAIAIILNILFCIWGTRNGVESRTYFIKSICLLGFLWPIAYIDFKTYKIPNLFVVYGLVLRAAIAVYEIIFYIDTMKMSLISEAIASAALFIASLLCVLIMKNSIGFGDIKLFCVMGFYLGLEGIFGAVFYSLVVSFIVACYVLITKKKNRKDTIPFGPAIVAGTYIAMFLAFK